MTRALGPDERDLVRALAPAHHPALRWLAGWIRPWRNAINRADQAAWDGELGDRVWDFHEAQRGTELAGWQHQAERAERENIAREGTTDSRPERRDPDWEAGQ
jgi:hypothetical protein